MAGKKNKKNKPKQQIQTKGKKKAKEEEETEKSTIKLIFLALGVCSSFLSYGWYMEKITRSEYGPEKERFKSTTVIVVMQALSCASTAAVILLLRGASLTAGVPIKHWLVVALGYFGAHEFGMRAFRYLTFPVQTICKACKAIPVMLGEKLIAGQHHKPSKYIGVGLLLFGIILFAYNNPVKASKMTNALFEWNANTLFGVVLIILALFCDGVYGPFQNKIIKICEKEGKTLYPHHLMFNMNIWQVLFSSIVCFFTGQFVDAIGFVGRHPEIIWNLLYFSATAVIGNLFIYQLQREYGALTVSLTTTGRKFLSILISVYTNGFSIIPIQWVGIGIIISSSIVSKGLARFCPQLDGKKLKKQ